MQFNHGPTRPTEPVFKGPHSRDSREMSWFTRETGVSKTSVRKKKTSKVYYIVTSINQKVQVCQKAILTIHSIGYTRIKNIRTATVCKQDMRGKQ